ncbi:LysR family transcriptional regulator [Amphritea sp. 2_MG-2023]|uniref:LysR substrate-binding domain-containing protein n=1 Tax=Amphritea TaxID=515417 RepID=UPI001C06C1D9|nr:MULTISPECIES: LysR family transcriptional regulator [Amphritea]MBU2965800.1 LysR family transcriptional regulator [Amphritea atlantica]MDO6417356.1 LysR family transcriptional regulator [Amphritea sp. 2_MG-2023]MDX2424495.1 LysR family transcriptional regulator [Amphritea sp.]
MQWHQLTGFYNLIRLGSFTKAAEACYRTQSAVTQQLQALESELDCKLAIRIGRGKIVATDEGQELFQFAEKMLREQKSVVERIHSIRDKSERTLIIAAPTDTMSKILSPYVKKFWQARPDVKLKMIECSLDEVVAGIRTQKFDLGFGLLAQVPTDLTQVRWLPMHHYIIAHKDHDIWRAPIDLLAISKCDLILPPCSEFAQTGYVLSSALSKKGLPCNIVMEASSNDRCIDYACSGMGVFFGLCSEEMLEHLPEDVLVKDLQSLFRSDNVGVFYESIRKLRVHDKYFIDILNIEI